MSDAELIAAAGFLLAFSLGIGARVEGRWNFEVMRGLLVVNAAVAALFFAASESVSLRGAVFYLVLAIGGTEAGCWLAIGLDRVLPEPLPDAGPRGSFRANPWRIGMMLVALGAAIVMFSIQSGRDEELAMIDAVELLPGEL